MQTTPALCTTGDRPWRSSRNQTLSQHKMRTGCPLIGLMPPRARPHPDKPSLPEGRHENVVPDGLQRSRQIHAGGSIASKLVNLGDLYADGVLPLTSARGAFPPWPYPSTSNRKTSRREASIRSIRYLPRCFGHPGRKSAPCPPTGCLEHSHSCSDRGRTQGQQAHDRTPLRLHPIGQAGIPKSSPTESGTPRDTINMHRTHRTHRMEDKRRPVTCCERPRRPPPQPSLCSL